MGQSATTGVSKRKQWHVKNEPSASNTVTPVTRKKRIPQSAISNSKNTSISDTKEVKRTDRSRTPKHNFRGRNQTPTGQSTLKNTSQTRIPRIEKQASI